MCTLSARGPVAPRGVTWSQVPSDKRTASRRYGCAHLRHASSTSMGTYAFISNDRLKCNTRRSLFARCTPLLLVPHRRTAWIGGDQFSWTHAADRPARRSTFTQVGDFLPGLSIMGSDQRRGLHKSDRLVVPPLHLLCSRAHRSPGRDMESGTKWQRYCNSDR